MLWNRQLHYSSVDPGGTVSGGTVVDVPPAQPAGDITTAQLVPSQTWTQEAFYCQRCGFRRAEGQIVMQRGLRVCTVTCFDNEDAEMRALLIQGILQDGSPEGSPVRLQEVSEVVSEEIYF